MMLRTPATRLRWGLAAALLGAVACSEEETFTSTSFSSPTGIVLAGPPSARRLFVANAGEDALQVVTLAEKLDDLELVRGDALQFPLRIPAGPSPRDLAATADGKYVVVLNGAGETLRLIDADALRPAARGGAWVIAPAGPRGAAPAALVAAPPPSSTCGAPSCGRFFVALAGSGAVSAFAVREDAFPAGPTLSLVRSYAVGGSPVALAVHPSGRWLYVADAAADAVLRLDLDSGIVLDRLAVGATPGAVAVSADGEALLVARPQWLDVAVFGGLSGAALEPLDADPRFAPVPACTDRCSAPGETCVGSQHPADAAVCGTGSGLAPAAGRGYTAVHLRGVPMRLLALGDDGSGTRTLTFSCDSTNLSYSQFAAVALASGEIHFIGLRRPGAALAPALVVSSGCNEPTIKSTDAAANSRGIVAPPLASYLGECPAAPARARFACVREEGGTAGAVVFRGATGTSSFTFNWEGPLRTVASGGVVRPHDPGPGEAAFTFSDVASDLGALNIEPRSATSPGDILQIVTAPKDDAACDAALGEANPRRCLLEWRILRVDATVRPARLILQARPHTLAPSCYPTDGTIAYRVRVGERYLVTRTNAMVGRAVAGDTIGPGGSIGAGARLLMHLAAPDPGPLEDPCLVYDDAGTNQVADKNLFSRDATFGFSVSDPLVPVFAGYDYSGPPGAPLAGILPGDMRLVEIPGRGGVVFVTYTASNSLLAFVPYDANKFINDGESRVLR